jgi:GAF domain-containing protein
MRSDPFRLEALRRLLILDTPQEVLYDEFTNLLALNLGVPIAIINMLDEKRDWFKSCVGLPMRESSAASSFCEVFFDTAVDLLVVEDTLRDARFSGNPLVIGPPFIRFYAGARLVISGQTVGTLCAYDVHPKKLTVEQLDHMRALAEAVIGALMARGKSPLAGHR